MDTRFRVDTPHGTWQLDVAPLLVADDPVAWVGKRVSQSTAIKGRQRVAFIRKATRYNAKMPRSGWFAEIRGFQWRWNPGVVFDLAPREGLSRNEHFLESLSEAKARVEEVLADYPHLDGPKRAALLTALAAKKAWQARWGLKERVGRARAEAKRVGTDYRIAVAVAAGRIAGVPSRNRSKQPMPPEERERFRIAMAQVESDPVAHGLPDPNRPRRRLRRR